MLLFVFVLKLKLISASFCYYRFVSGDMTTYWAQLEPTWLLWVKSTCLIFFSHFDIFIPSQMVWRFISVEIDIDIYRKITDTTQAREWQQFCSVLFVYVCVCVCCLLIGFWKHNISTNSLPVYNQVMKKRKSSILFRLLLTIFLPSTSWMNCAPFI